MRKPIKNVCEWHDWFAWHPVIINGEMVWGEKVQRKFVDTISMAGGDWKYRMKDENPIS